jgi:hypothetical protein
LRRAITAFYPVSPLFYLYFCRNSTLFLLVDETQFWDAPVAVAAFSFSRERRTRASFGANSFLS